jgi:hypothetical protein
VSLAGVLRIVEFCHSSAIVGLHVTELSQDSATFGALARLGSYSAGQVPQPVHAAASPTLQKRGKRLKADRRRGPNDIQTPIVLLAGIGEPRTKSIIGPLEEQVGERVENCVLIDRFFLQFDTADPAKAILIVLKNSTGQELIEHLSLTASERHLMSSPY